MPGGWLERVKDAGRRANRFAGSRWVYAYVAAIVPLALGTSLAFGSAVCLVVLDPLLFFPVFAMHLYRRRFGRLTALASFWGTLKCLLLIAVVAGCGDAVDGMVDGGPAYHEDTYGWITTGEGQIAHPEIFAWKHLWGLGRVTLTSAASGGLTTLVGGSRELNIMSFHVGKLLQGAADPWTVLLWGWPIWSLLRGWAYLLVIFGAGPLFFCILQRRWPERGLAAYFGAGVALAAVDVGLKIWLAPAWRLVLLSAR